MTGHRRTPIKIRSPRQEIWRDRFKKQCENRIKDARSTQIHQRRENQASFRAWLQQIVLQEWERFRRENEAALQLEADDLESAIEENLLEELQESYDPSWDEFMQLEEDAMAEAFEDYQQQKAMVQSSSKNRIASDVSEESHQQLCFGCNNGVLQSSANDSSIWQCPNCQLRANEECMQLLQHHSSICSGHILYSRNSPGDTFILCSDCELCAAL